MITFTVIHLANSFLQSNSQSEGEYGPINLADKGADSNISAAEVKLHQLARKKCKIAGRTKSYG